MPTILIKRAGGWQDMLRSYQVIINGVAVGKVKRNAEVSLAVEPGTHKVRLKIDWCGSPEITVTLAADEVRTLHCARASMFSPYWIDLQDHVGKEVHPSHATSSGAGNSQADYKKASSSDERDREADSDFRQFNTADAESMSAPCYAVLGIKYTATVAEIRSAYHQLQSQYHPDKVAHLGRDLIALAEEKSKDINRAYFEAMRAASRRPGNEA